MAARIQKILFLTVLFFIPIQFGKHFWPPFAFITGARVDYLSPTLYVTDIIILLLFFSVVLRRQLGVLMSPLFSMQGVMVKVAVFALLTVAFSSIFSLVPIRSFYAVARWIEMGFLLLYITSFIRKKDLLYCIEVFCLGGLFVSLLAFLQLMLQHSVGGLFYFLGERTFGVSSIGVATIHTPNGLFLRPYATFSHPNVLAFYLLLVTVISTIQWSVEKTKKEKIFLSVVSIIASIALVLTFSRVIIGCWVVFLLIMSARMFKKRVVLMISSGILLLSLFLLPRFLDIGRDLGYRLNLIQLSWSIFQKHPYVGVGPLQFFEHEIIYQKIFSPIFLQPVHNIFLLILVELGLLGLVSMLYFTGIYMKSLYSAVHRKKDKETHRFTVGILFLSAAVIVVGMFDHFFITVYQGQLVLTIIVGFGIRAIVSKTK